MPKALRTEGRVTCITSLLCSTVVLRSENRIDLPGPTGQDIASEDDIPPLRTDRDNIPRETPPPRNGWPSRRVHGRRVFLTSRTHEDRSFHVPAVDERKSEILPGARGFEQTPEWKRDGNSRPTPTPVSAG